MTPLHCYRAWAMPSGDTFSIPPILSFVKRWTELVDVVVDPFARNSRLATHRNDLDPDTQAESHMDAEAFCLELAIKRVAHNDTICIAQRKPHQLALVPPPPAENGQRRRP